MATGKVESLATSTATLTSAYASSPETAYVKRYGNVVFFQFTAALTSALPMNTTFTVIPSGYRPANNKTRLTGYNSSDRKAILMDLNSDGQVQLIDYGSTLAAETVVQLSGTYVV